MTLPASIWLRNVDQMVCIMGQRTGNMHSLSWRCITHTDARTPSGQVICIYMTVSVSLDMQFKNHIVRKEARHTCTHMPSRIGTFICTQVITRSHAAPRSHTLSHWHMHRSQTPNTHRTGATGQICLVTPLTQTPFRVIWRLMRYN